MTDIQARIDIEWLQEHFSGNCEMFVNPSAIRQAVETLRALEVGFDYVATRKQIRELQAENNALMDIVGKEYDTDMEIAKLKIQIEELQAQLSAKDAIIAELQKENESCRSTVIEEICEKYIGEIIKNYRYQCKNDPMIGPYSFDKEIAWHERLMRALRKQEWVEPPKGI